MRGFVLGIITTIVVLAGIGYLFVNYGGVSLATAQGLLAGGVDLFMIESMANPVETAVAVRMARRDANDKVKGLLKDKKITEDENKKAGDQIQKITDEYNTKVDQMTATKEKEIMTL